MRSRKSGGLVFVTELGLALALLVVVGIMGIWLTWHWSSDKQEMTLDTNSAQLRTRRAREATRAMLNSVEAASRATIGQ